MAASNSPAEQLVTENIDVWTSAIKKRGSQGRGSSKKIELYGIKKLRELILELAVRGLLVPQDPNDEPASVLLEKIAAGKEQLIKKGKTKKQKALPEISEDEKPFELPSGWEWARMGDLAEYQKGHAFKSKDYLDKGLMITKIQNLTENSIQNSVYIAPEKTLDFEQYTLKERDIVMTTVGSWFSAPDSAVGRSFLINKIFDSSLLNQNAVRIRFRSKLSSMYLFSCVNSPVFKKYLLQEAQGTANQASITQSSIKTFVLSIPPEAEQPRIVAKVDELMALCDQLEQQTESSLLAHQTLVETLLNTLVNADQNSFDQAWERIAQHFDILFTTEHSIDQLKQTILQLAVMGKLVPQDPNDEPASVLLEKIAAEKEQLIKDKVIKKQKPLAPISEDEKPFELPKGWEWVRLGEISRLMSGKGFKKSEYSESGAKLFQIANVSLGHTKWEIENFMPLSYLDDYPELKLFQGDVLIALNRPLLNRKMKVCILSEQDLPAILYQRVGKFDFYEKTINTKYFYYFMQSALFIEHLNSNLQGSDQPFINQSQLVNFLYPLPSFKEQSRVVSKIDELLVFCNSLKSRICDSQTTQLHLADAMAEQALN